MGKGRDKKKKKKQQQQSNNNKLSSSGKAKATRSDDSVASNPHNKQPKKKAKFALDSSDDDDDDDDLEAILESFKAEQAQKVKVCQEASATGPSPRVNWSIQYSQSGSEAILFGGEHFDGKCTRFFNDLFRCDVKGRGSNASLHWKRVQSLNAPTPRSSQQAVITPGGTQMFMFGGEFGSSRETRFFHYRDFWMLDLKTYAWEELTSTCKPLPTPRSGHRMAMWKHLVAMFGGFYDAGAETKYLDDLWLFDTRAYKWTKADWFNDPNTRPSPRSGFQFIPVESGILLYGGYCQVKGRGGACEGVVLADMWHLRLDADDLRRTRWEKRKISASAQAPLPRSGPAACPGRNGKSFYLFGGVRDEAVGEEFLNGTCLNDLWEYSVDKGSWRQLQVPGTDAIVPRYNASLTLLGSQQQLLLIGGIWEREDRQYVLDDAYILNAEKMDKWSCVRPLTVDLENWEGSDSDSDDEDSDEDSDEITDSDSDDSDDYTSSSSYSSSEDDSHVQPARTSNIDAPQPFPNQTLKDYFAANMSFWADRAQSRYPTMTNAKQLRGEAFQLAQQAYNEFELERLFLK